MERALAAALVLDTVLRVHNYRLAAKICAVAICLAFHPRSLWRFICCICQGTAGIFTKCTAIPAGLFFFLPVLSRRALHLALLGASMLEISLRHSHLLPSAERLAATISSSYLVRSACSSSLDSMSSSFWKLARTQASETVVRLPELAEQLPYDTFSGSSRYDDTF